MSPERPHYFGHRERLRQRFIKNGLDGFADYEVVELLLTLAIPRRDVKEPAKALITRFGNLRGILDAPLDELRKIEGVGEVTPVALRIIREAASLYLQQAAEQRDSSADPEALFLFWRTKIGALPNEVFQVGYLDSGYRLLRGGIETLEEGTVDRAAVYPRRVMQFTINLILKKPLMRRSRDKILKVLEENQKAIRGFGVRRLGLFGSCARGEETEISDLDFVVEFEKNSFDAYMDLKIFLEEMFKCKVDLVLADSIKPRLRETILREAVHVPGL